MGPKWALALEKLRNKGGSVAEYTRLVKGLGNLHLGMKAMRVFNDLRQHHHPDTTAYNTALQALSKDNHDDAPPMALKLLDDMGSSADVVSYTSCITAQKQWEMALKVAQRAKDNGIAFDIVSHGAIVTALSRGGNHARARQWFDAVPAPRSAALFGAVIRGSPWRDAISLLDRMEGERVEKSVTIYNQCIGTVGAEWPIALQLFDQLRGTLVPNVRSYNAVLMACRHAWQEAIKVFKLMASPSIISYNIVLDALAKGKQWEKALALLAHMPFESANPDAISYTAVIHALGSDWPRATNLLTQCPKPDLACYNACLRSLSQATEWKKALALLQSMEDVDIRKDDISRTLAIACCPWEEAIKLLPRKPREIPWVAAIGVLDAAGEIGRAQELFCALVSAGVVPLQEKSLIDLHEFTVPLAKAQIREAGKLHDKLILIVGKGHHRGDDTLHRELVRWFHDMHIDVSFVNKSGRIHVRLP